MRAKLSLSTAVTEPKPKEYLLSKSNFQVTEKGLSRNTPSRGLSDNPLTDPEPPNRKWSASLRKNCWVVGEFLLCCVPLFFDILAICAWQLNGQHVSQYGENIRHMTQLSPTLFPIIFAAVIGRSLRNIARYELEQGSRVKILEQLLGSQSVSSTVWTQFSLGSLNRLGIALLVLWSISPLGGQASLRLLSTTPDRISETILYVDYASSAIDLNIKTLQVNTVYLNALAWPVEIKHSPRDVWNNIKIPTLESLSSVPDQDGFRNVSDSTPFEYSLLIGVPVFGLPDTPTLNATLQTMYYDVKCSKFDSVNGTDNSWIQSTGIKFPDQNETNYINVWSAVDNSTVTFGMWSPDYSSSRSSNYSAYLTDRSFLWFSWPPRPMDNCTDNRVNCYEIPQNISLANCTLSPSYVDVNISCVHRVCLVNAMRPAGRGRNEGDLMRVGDTFSAWSRLMTNTRLGNAYLSPTELYINGVEDFPFIKPDIILPLTNPMNFTSRLQRLINTYYSASTASTLLVHQEYRDYINEMHDTILDDRNGGRLPFTDLLPSFSKAKAITVTEVDVYSSRIVMVIATMVISIITSIVAFIGFASSCYCKQPDTLGYLTSTLRYSPHTATVVKANISTSDTTTVIKKNASMEVKIQRISDEGGTGEVAIISTEDYSAPLSQVITAAEVTQRQENAPMIKTASLTEAIKQPRVSTYSVGDQLADNTCQAEDISEVEDNNEPDADADAISDIEDANDSESPKRNWPLP